MRLHPLLLCALLCFVTSVAAAQQPAFDPGSSPARSILRFRAALELSEAQAARLEQLGEAQARIFSQTTAAFLRAEADVIDASTTEDLVKRRTALEKRSRVAIDAEIARLKAEKDAHAVLTAEQRTRLVAAIAEAESEGAAERASLWKFLVSPSAFSAHAPDQSDSAEVRAIVQPAHAEIYIGGVKRGAGRMSTTLPVGRHELRFHAPGCQEVVVPITVVKGPPLFVPAQTLICR